MITLEQIAKEAGVSRQTVANALNRTNKENWGSTARRAARIREVAARMGYLPNVAAKAVRSGKFDCVALILSMNTPFSHLPQAMWQGIHDDLAEHNMHLTMFRLPDDVLKDTQQLPKILREWMADGMLIDYTTSIPRELIEIIELSDMPAVWLNTLRTENCVRPDDRAASVAATEYLLSLGHRRIAYVDFHALEAPNGTHYSASERLDGYRQTMASSALPEQIVTGTRVQSDLLPACKSIVCDPDAPTAILCYGSLDAEYFIVAGAAVGREIPSDFSLMTFGPTDVRIVGIEISRMVVPEYETGRRASELLRAKISQPEASFPSEAVPFAIAPGQTCASPKK